MKLYYEFNPYEWEYEYETDDDELLECLTEIVAKELHTNKYDKVKDFLESFVNMKELEGWYEYDIREYFFEQAHDEWEDRYKL